MINFIICEDNEKDRRNVISIVKEFIIENKLNGKIHLFDDYDNRFYITMKDKIVNKIYLLDIEMPSGSGIDIARKIRRTDVDSVITFLTAHEELGNIILKNDLMYLSFINKFDNFKDRLNDSLKKSLDILNQKQVIKFTDRNISYTIKLNDILYVTTESFERKTIIKTDYSEFKVNKTLSEIVSMLDNRFIQTHRACYINSDRKVMIDKNTKMITFDNNETINLLSDKFKKVVC